MVVVMKRITKIIILILSIIMFYITFNFNKVRKIEYIIITKTKEIKVKEFTQNKKGGILYISDEGKREYIPLKDIEDIKEVKSIFFYNNID